MRKVKLFFSFSYRVRGLPYPQNYRRMIADINGGLNATKRNIYWRLTLLSPKNIWGTEHDNSYGGTYLASEIGTIRIDADLSNSSGRYVSSAISTSVLWDYLWGGVLYVDKFNTKIGIGYLTDFLPDLLSWSSISGRGAFEVDAKDITDQMTIRITANLQDTTSGYHRTLIPGSSYKILTVTEAEYRTLSRR